MQKGRNHSSSVIIEIDELILEGFAPSEKYRIADAVQQELARLLTAQSVHWTRGAELEQLRVDAAGVHPRAPSATNGAHIARAVYEGLHQQK
jgi:hypothetical protein